MGIARCTSSNDMRALGRRPRNALISSIKAFRRARSKSSRAVLSRYFVLRSIVFPAMEPHGISWEIQQAVAVGVHNGGVVEPGTKRQTIDIPVGVPMEQIRRTEGVNKPEKAVEATMGDVGVVVDAARRGVRDQNVQ